ncbi:histidine protein methyltransferase 1 homolog [Drosophila ficusphila]|uniref:histidine protein methyltransferase 1 homolog n=1 Tax=Drosophila ficusphila TaxID=30025 RepID=UPI0007E662BD|nr:histidine protein methyltransferase 1 homolog [Drosophila ficusphila]
MYNNDSSIAVNGKGKSNQVGSSYSTGDQCCDSVVLADSCFISTLTYKVQHFQCTVCLEVANMFKFNFEVEADSSIDPEVVKSPIFNKKEDSIEPDLKNTNDIEWYQAEKVKPIDNLISTLDFYELNAKETSVQNTTIRHLVAGFLLEDIKAQTHLENLDIRKSEENHSDLIAGVYEGGAKIWECTDDLLLYLSEKYDDSFWKDKRVLDLGCGSGLLGIYAIKHGARVDFQDYNKDVLEYITYPNILLNVDETLSDDEKLEFLDKNTSLYSGDWSNFTQLTQGVEKYDLILTSETIYNIENQQKLLETFAGRLKPDGIIFVAAKMHYFGVGGGLEQFSDKIKHGNVFQSQTVWQADKNLRRGILELKFK